MTQGILGFGLISSEVSGPGIDPVTLVPGWVGIAWGGTTACGLAPTAEDGGDAASDLPNSGYVAVVAGLASEDSPLTYLARTSRCGEPASEGTVSPASQVLSLPWTAVGVAPDGVLAIRYSVPSCARRLTTNVSSKEGTFTVTVEAIVPSAETPCAEDEATAEIKLDSVGASVPTSSDIAHAPVGPLIQFRP